MYRHTHTYIYIRARPYYGRYTNTIFPTMQSSLPFKPMLLILQPRTSLYIAVVKILFARCYTCVSVRVPTHVHFHSHGSASRNDANERLVCTMISRLFARRSFFRSARAFFPPISPTWVLYTYIYSAHIRREACFRFRRLFCLGEETQGAFCPAAVAAA